MQITNVMPVIYTHRIWDTLRFYSILGFDYEYDFYDNPKSWSVLRWENHEIMVTTPDPYDTTRYQTAIHIETDTLEEIRERIEMITYGEHYISPVKHNREMDRHEFFLHDNNRNMVLFFRKS